MRNEQIEAAARAIAACMDYPWEHMPEQGRDNMRKHAKTVMEAALTSAPAEPDEVQMRVGPRGKWRRFDGNLTGALALVASNPGIYELRFLYCHPAPAETPPAAGAIDARGQETSTAAELRSKLLAAANYIDVLGGDSKNFRAALASRSEAPAAAGAALAVAEPPLLGRWHHGEGVLCSGSLRIARWDCDTNPPSEFRDKALDWVCNVLTAEVDRYKAAQPIEREDGK